MQPKRTTSETKTGMEVGISERLENDIPIKTAKLGAFPPPHLFHEYIVYTVFCGRAIPTLDGFFTPSPSQLPAPMGSISSSRPNCFSNCEALSFTTDSMLSWRNIKRPCHWWGLWRKPFRLRELGEPTVPPQKIGKNKSTTGYILGFPLGFPWSWLHLGHPITERQSHCQEAMGCTTNLCNVWFKLAETKIISKMMKAASPWCHPGVWMLDVGIQPHCHVEG